jgi:hypothetical protein
VLQLHLPFILFLPHPDWNPLHAEHTSKHSYGVILTLVRPRPSVYTTTDPQTVRQLDRRSPGSISGQVTWNLWWTKWHWGRFCRSLWPRGLRHETVFSRSNARIVGSNTTPGMDDCVRLFCVCVVLCVGSGLATG